MSDTEKSAPATLREAWLDYRRLVVPKEAGLNQVQQLRGAFHAGALSALNAMNRLAALPELEALETLRALVLEAERECENVIREMKDSAGETEAT